MDIETVKYVVAIFLVIIFWVFIGAPAFLGLAFDFSPQKYLDAVKGGLCFSLVIICVVAFTAAFSFVAKTIFI